MKKFIKFLAQISGVENEIRRDERFDIGHRMRSDMYWWTGGSLGKAKYEVLNAFYLYSKNLLRGSGTDISPIRSEVYKIGEQLHSDL